MIDINKIHNMEASEFLKTLPDCFIDLTVTSPPYDNLRIYNGYLFDFESIAKELYRVTKEGGVIVWIVGDATIKGSETGTSFRQALYFKEIGFNLHDTMIYKKEAQPLSHNRYEQKFEYMFIFSKGKPLHFNAIMEKSKNFGQKRTGTMRQDSDILTSRNAKGHIKEYKIKGNVWEYNVGGKRDNNLHPAIFPEQLANDHIISWSNEGDLVLDCFMGSGTTAKMALINNRNFIGCEMSEEYVTIANKRLEAVQGSLF